MSTKKTIIISNRLPVRIERIQNELHIVPSEGGLATGLSAVYDEGNNFWIGWPGFIPANEQEAQFVREKLSDMNLIPIFLTEEEVSGYYEGFSNEVLWPIFHYSQPYAVYDTPNWATYQRVNKKFGEAVLNLELAIDDIIWVHDYQLMLLPQFLREQSPDITIGYFQHIPFPPDELFRNIPWRNELLMGLLGADLVAFHTFNDSQHFLNACRHILGLSVKDNILQNVDRSIFVEVFPMGIDFQKFRALAASEAVQQRSRDIQDFYGNRKIILSVDRLDYSKGILERLDAYESLLQEYPELREKVMLYMLVVPSRDTVPQYMALRNEIDRRVGQINAVYGVNEWTPIAYFYNSFPIKELSALYTAADICLITSLRDGMNLVCKEYVASKENSNGVLILSELAGASKELTEALLINPNSKDNTRESLKIALEMPIEEQRRRMNDNIEIVRKFNVKHWVKIFFSRLLEIKALQKQEMARRMRPQLRENIWQRYQQAKKRLFLLDYDGTLIGFHKNAADAIPTEALYHSLELLQNNPANQVVIISGRPHETLGRWFDGKGYYLVAEHGAWTNFPDFEWHGKGYIATPWKIPVKHIMDKLANRTAGAVVEEKAYSLAWHYRKVQGGLGQLRSQELVDQLRYLIPAHGLQLLMGDMVVEIKSSEINKGKAAMEIANNLSPDFIFAIGDDVTDEDMFQMLPEGAITVKVGNKKSDAKYYVENQQEAFKLISYLASGEPRT